MKKAFRRISFLLFALSLSAPFCATATDSPNAVEVRELQQKIMADKDIMALILSLQNDPDVQALMSDPAVLDAVQSGNLDALAKNPKLLKLLNNEQVREIGKHLQ